jgi:hypothetical protein
MNEQKRAFFIIGPESSGTRLLTHILIDAGCYGNDGHYQSMDGRGYRGEFYDRPPRIVFRRSVPHAGLWPPIQKLIERMRQAGYEVTVLVTVRDLTATARSQVLRNHEASTLKAHDNIDRAYRWIFDEVTRAHPAGLHVVPYEAGILHIEAVDALLQHLGLDCTASIHLTDENGKHYA